MIKEFNVIVERDFEGYYVASVPQLPGCHTQAKSMDKLLSRVKEAFKLCLEEYNINEEPNEFMGIQKVAVQV